MGKPGDACWLAALTHSEANEDGRWRRAKETERGGSERERAAVYVGYLQGDTAGRERETDKHTWTDGDLERDWQRGVKEKMRERKPTDVQTNKLWEWGVKESDSPGVLKKKTNPTELHYCYSAGRSSGVLWTTILADWLQTKLLTKSRPLRLRGSPGRWGSSLRCLSQHGWGLCWLWLSEASAPCTSRERGNIITSNQTYSLWMAMRSKKKKKKKETELANKLSEISSSVRSLHCCTVESSWDSAHGGRL